MRVAVTIDRLRVTGPALSRWDRAALGPAIQRELARMIHGGAPADLPPLARARTGTVDRIAREVAVSVHGAIATPSRRGGER